MTEDGGWQKTGATSLNLAEGLPPPAVTMLLGAVGGESKQSAFLQRVIPRSNKKLICAELDVKFDFNLTSISGPTAYAEIFSLDDVYVEASDGKMRFGINSTDIDILDFKMNVWNHLVLRINLNDQPSFAKLVVNDGMTIPLEIDTIPMNFTVRPGLDVQGPAGGTRLLIDNVRLTLQ